MNNFIFENNKYLDAINKRLEMGIYADDKYTDIDKEYKKRIMYGEDTSDLEEQYDKMETSKELPKIKYTEQLTEILEVLESENCYVSFELLYMLRPTSKYVNTLRIETVDISKHKDCFDVKFESGKNKIAMKIKNYIDFYFGKDYFYYDYIDEFLENYNTLVGSTESETRTYKDPRLDDLRQDKYKSGHTHTPSYRTYTPYKPEPKGEKIQISKFQYKPKDVRNTFLSLVQKTHPHGYEHQLLPFLPKLLKDKVGNYYKVVGKNSTTMFTCHLDTADKKQSKVDLYTIKDGSGDEFIQTGGVTILGADDKAGATIMTYMIENNVPGIYYFFIGEEVGCVGSSKLSNVLESTEHLKGVTKCISFDRRDVNSVIIEQLGRVCCSIEFANALANELNKSGLNYKLDPGGIYTDSASFIEQIPECTNLSVGYYSEHSGREKQNITFLEKLAKACIAVKWEELPIVRKVVLDENIRRKYGQLINDLKKTFFAIDVKVTPEDDNSTVISCDLEEGIIGDTYDSLVLLYYILEKHNLNQTCYFDEEKLKIILP